MNQAALIHGMPPSTLKDRMSGRVLHGSKPGPVPYLAPEEEDELIGYLLKASQLGYGKTRRQVKEIVERVATTKGILCSESISDGWWKRFLQRHGNIALRSGNATAHVRMEATNKENIKHYFKLLKEIFDTNDFAAHPERVYNMDESGMPLDPKPPKVVSLKGQKKVVYRTSGKKGQKRGKSRSWVVAVLQVRPSHPF